MTSTIPDEAVQAAEARIARLIRLSSTLYEVAKEALTAALPFLPVLEPSAARFPCDPTEEMVDAALAVEWENEDERATVIDIWHAMTAKLPVLQASTGTDEGQTVKAMESCFPTGATSFPNAEQNVACGGIIKRLNDDIAQLTKMVQQAQFAGAETGVRVKSPSILLKDLCDAVDTIRALSSPDHADAGKVEGDDGRPCSMDEFMAALFNEKVDEFDVSEAATSWLHGDWKDALSYLTEVPTHWRHLPSAPASEGAE